jgi:hypothetical protein
MLPLLFCPDVGRKQKQRPHHLGHQLATGRAGCLHLALQLCHEVVVTRIRMVDKG